MLKRLVLLFLISLQAWGYRASPAEKKADQLFKKISELQKSVSTPGEFIAQLPEELRKNFTFVHTSRSPHREEANYDYPRIILFSDDARIVLAFETNPTSPGYHMVELLRFNDREQNFELRASILGPAPNTFQGLVGKNWEPNPQACLKCHGSDVRPIFDSYPLWPGFYGSAEDTFPATDHGPDELKRYQKFITEKKNAEPFNKLIFSNASPVWPYLDPKLHNATADVADLHNFKFMPNTRLGIALTELNRERLSRKILESKKLNEYSEALLSGLLRCTRLPISKDLKNKVETKMTQENQARLFRMRIDPFSKHDDRHDLQELKFSQNLAALEYMTETLDLSRKDWSMALEPYSFSFFDGVLSSVFQNTQFYAREDFIYILLRDLAHRDKKFKKYFRSKPVYALLDYPFGNRLDFDLAFKSCDLLDQTAAKKKIALKELPESTEVKGSGDFFAPAQKGSASSVFAKCI
ncbi:MAG: hypothetical protein ACXVAX_05890, partial [Pseudobdellovibrio sp.]